MSRACTIIAVAALTSAAFGATDGETPTAAATPETAASGAESAAPVAALAAEVEEARARLRLLTVERDEAEAKARALARRLDEAEGRSAALADSLAAARAEADRFRREWEGSAVDRALVGGWVAGEESGVRDRFEAVCRELVLARGQRDRLVDRLAALADAVAAGEDPVALRAEIGAARTALDRVAEERVAGTPVVAGIDSLDRCRVLSVNPDLNVVVLTAGGVDGVRAGMEMRILRADAPVATVRVVETRDRVCAAVIQEFEDRDGGPRVGDLARLAPSGS